MSNISPDQDLDLSFLYDIADGSNEFIVESIDMFLQHTPDLLQTIETSVAGKEWGTASSAAHKLKSNLGFFGMPISHSIIQAIEVLTKADFPDEALIGQKFNEVYAIISANLVTLKEIKAEKEAEM